MALVENTHVTHDPFDDFFQTATTHPPYDYQRRLAHDEPVRSHLIHVPTGCGKTAAVILGWLWQRKTNPDNTPRRLVYCLPMRVLVEQTCESAKTWLKNLALGDKVGAHVLMGGEDADDWDLYPERDAILIGTQDMLLSRALNRGYGMSRYRWPMHFGLLHTDCLWVFDEVQLMGSGLATTAQLEGFRSTLNQHGCSCFWMSATLQPDWLRTVDFDPESVGPPVKLNENDLKQVRDIREARKPLQATNSRTDDRGLAKEIVAAHMAAQREIPGGRTLVVVNTVARARELHIAVRELTAAGVPLDPILIHSRFRPLERAEQIKRLLAEPGQHGMIVVSTQVVEAGVDVSARTLFSELAPWSSLVQRFGRCNRRGLDNDTAQVFWIDLPKDEKQEEKARHPYELDELVRSRELLRTCKDVGPASLEAVPFKQPFRHAQVIRRKDFIELFDTTPDLAGNDIDVEPYVREVDECDVQVFWREWAAEGAPSSEIDSPRREELCPVPIGEFRQFVKEGERRSLAFRWDYLDRQWVRVDSKRIYAGQIYLLHTSAAGYAPDAGWNIKLDKPVSAIKTPHATPTPEANDDDSLSELTWQSIAKHTDRVCNELEDILATLPVPESPALRLAARWHDRGKAHEIFQQAIRAKRADGQTRPADWVGRTDIAKAPRGWWNKYERKRFRHELASALAALISLNDNGSADTRDLVAYLIAAHHGKVRLSIRSLPEESIPPNDYRFARGVWDNDNLPATDLGGGIIAPAVSLSLEPMELGLCEQLPFKGQPSWVERMLVLRDSDKFGPFRLAYLEAILRAADARASMTPARQEPSHA